MLPDVVVLEPLLLERPWGGRRLASYGRPLPADVRVGESWELVDLAEGVAHGVSDACSRVLSPGWEGTTLGDMIDQAGQDLLGSARPTVDGRFPLIVKLLDARENLSVQVHPHLDFETQHPEFRQKTESWYVVAADPGAELFVGITDAVDDEAVSAAIGTSAIVPMLTRRPAVPGDFHHVPAGRIHALGAGTFVLEVQTPSDSTFRIYDWATEYGRSPRTLHPDDARRSWIRHDSTATSLAADASLSRRPLVVTPWYSMTEHRPAAPRLRLDRGGEMVLLTVVSGTAELGGVLVPAPSTVVVPAGSPIESATVSDGAVLVETRLV